MYQRNIRLEKPRIFLEKIEALEDKRWVYLILVARETWMLHGFSTYGDIKTENQCLHWFWSYTETWKIGFHGHREQGNWQRIPRTSFWDLLTLYARKSMRWWLMERFNLNNFFILHFLFCFGWVISFTENNNII